MKWNILKPYIALICLSTQLLPAPQAPIKKEPNHLSPRSSFATSLTQLLSHSENLPLPSIAETQINFPFTYEMGYLDKVDFKEMKDNRNRPITIQHLSNTTNQYMVTHLGNTRVAKKLEFVLQYDLENSIESKPGKNGGKKQNGNTKRIVISEENNKKDFVSFGFDLEAKDAVILKEFPKQFLIIENPIDVNDPKTNTVAYAYRAWDYKNTKKVILLEPYDPSTKKKIRFPFRFIKNPVDKDKYGNNIFRGVKTETGKEAELIEIGDYLIEKEYSQTLGMKKVMAWNRRKNKLEILHKIVANVTIEENKVELKEFFIIGPLGKGGFGIVLKALDPKIKNFVALKQPILYELEEMMKKFYITEISGNNVIAWNPKEKKFGRFSISSQNLNDDAIKTNLGRFERESKMMWALNHKNVMKILGKGDKPRFFIMEFLKGKTLQEILIEKREKKEFITLTQIITMLEQIAEGTDFIHGKGIIHLDIKPDNIFVTSTGNVVIIDFGLSYEEFANLELDGILGSPTYASPEQLACENLSELDRKTDIYALGIVLYELITGNDPFIGNPTQTTAIKKGAKNLHEEFLYSGMFKKLIERVDTLKNLEKKLKTTEYSIKVLANIKNEL